MVEGVFSFKEERKELTVKLTLKVDEEASLADIWGTGDSRAKAPRMVCAWCVGEKAGLCGCSPVSERGVV